CSHGISGRGVHKADEVRMRGCEPARDRLVQATWRQASPPVGRPEGIVRRRMVGQVTARVLLDGAHQNAIKVVRGIELDIPWVPGQPIDGVEAWDAAIVEDAERTIACVEADGDRVILADADLNRFWKRRYCHRGGIQPTKRKSRTPTDERLVRGNELTVV